MYRPEDTHKSRSAVREADLNLVYWGGGECQVEARIVRGKCHVVSGEELPDNNQDWFPDNCFYFHEAYDSATRSFVDPPSRARSRNKGKVNFCATASSVYTERGGLWLILLMLLFRGKAKASMLLFCLWSLPLPSSPCEHWMCLLVVEVRPTVSLEPQKHTLAFVKGSRAEVVALALSGLFEVLTLSILDILTCNFCPYSTGIIIHIANLSKKLLALLVAIPSPFIALVILGPFPLLLVSVASCKKNSAFTGSSRARNKD